MGILMLFYLDFDNKAQNKIYCLNMRRRLLNDICQIEFVDKIDTIAGDVCIVDNNSLDKLFISQDSIECINSNQYTPIGVVVVPASHTDDGTAKVMSLMEMNYSNPDNGGNCHTITWGGYHKKVDGLIEYNKIPIIADSYSGITTSQNIISWGNVGNNIALPSNYYDINNNPFDIITYYGNNDYKIAPSPYLNDGSKNEIYHSTANTGNILSDMDGKGNTEKILAVDNSYSTDWQTANTIINHLDATVGGYTYYTHTAVQCCWRYHTVGTQQGDWYLPSVGEIGYLISRIKEIKFSIDKLSSLSKYNSINFIVNNQTHYWTSNDDGYSNAFDITIYTDYCVIKENEKYKGTVWFDGWVARAFTII